MPHGTAQHWTIPIHHLGYYSVIQCMYTYTEATALSTRLTSCEPYVLQKTYLSQVNSVVVTTFIVHYTFVKFGVVYVLYLIVLTFGVIHK